MIGTVVIKERWFIQGLDTNTLLAVGVDVKDNKPYVYMYNENPRVKVNHARLVQKAVLKGAKFPYSDFIAVAQLSIDTIKKFSEDMTKLEARANELRKADKTVREASVQNQHGEAQDDRQLQVSQDNAQEEQTSGENETSGQGEEKAVQENS